MKHAEILALEEAGEQARGATLYITLEPARTRAAPAPCADALIAAGVSRVVAAMEDPNPQVAGRGFRKLRDGRHRGGDGCASSPAEAEKLNEAFVHFMRTGRPLVTLKSGADAGRQDRRAGRQSRLDHQRDGARAHVQQLRHDSDAILTGIGTVLADDCLLTDRTGLARSRPLLRIVLDSQLRIPLDSQDGDELPRTIWWW